MESLELDAFNLVKFFTKRAQGSYKSCNSPEVEVTLLQIDGLNCGTLAEPNIEKIRELSKPAPFGKDGETVLDESVRKASEISGERIKFKPSLLTFREALPLPYPGDMAGKEVLYKLHMYEAPGGKFEMHRDTPHDMNHLGTFVICLPTPFEGGDLVIHSANGEETRLGCRKDEDGKAQSWWAFFFTDCEHAVEPVTSGTRIVLQYDFFVDPEIEIEPVELVHRFYFKGVNFDERGTFPELIPKKFKNSQMSLDSSLKSKVKDAKLNSKQSEDLIQILHHFFNKKMNLGIVLSHMYPTFGDMKARLLRGRDRLLYNCIIDVKDRLPEMKLFFRYLISEQEREETCHVKTETYVLENSFIEIKPNENYLFAESTADLIDEESMQGDDLSHPYNGANLIVAQHPGGYFKVIMSNPGSEYTGNESMPEKVTYATCILIIEFFKPSPHEIRK